MAKKSKDRKRSPSRNKRGPASRSRRSPRQHQRRTRRRGGAEPIRGAPVEYSLSGSWPSRMSLGQGQDYFKYHVGQHGGHKKRRRGGSLSYGAYPAAIGQTLPQGLRMAAHVNGLDKAIADVLPLRDPGQMGGRRRSKRRGSKRRGSKRRGSKRRGSKRRGSKRRGSKRRGSKRRCMSRRMSRRRMSRRRMSRRRGGATLVGSPFPGKTMLLDSPREYAQAGLNPQWKTDVAFDLAEKRATQ